MRCDPGAFRRRLAAPTRFGLAQCLIHCWRGRVGRGTMRKRGNGWNRDQIWKFPPSASSRFCRKLERSFPLVPLLPSSRTAGHWGTSSVEIGSARAVSCQIRTLFQAGTLGGLTDRQLLERFAMDPQEKAEAAFGVLLERHGPMVLRVCRGVLDDPLDAQDAFQATFLVLVKKARALWVRDSLGPWLHQVAYRTACCARSDAARRRRHERRAAAEAVARRVSELGGLDTGWERVLHEEIARLPPHYRAAVVLCDLQGCTHEQAAQHLGCRVGTVKSRLARGRGRLRGRLLREVWLQRSGRRWGCSFRRKRPRCRWHRCSANLRFGRCSASLLAARRRPIGYRRGWLHLRARS